jgi:hypothetical protein
MEFIGIDFSGNVHSWRASNFNANIWLCRVNCSGIEKPKVIELRRIQDLDGTGPQFRRLAAACMKLLATALSPPCWPWSSDSTEGLIAEAFPAAQLRRGAYRSRSTTATMVATLRDKLFWA